MSSMKTRCIVMMLLLSAVAGIASATDPALEKVIRDYVGLYRQDSLEEWKKLFHPSLTVAHPGDDGAIRVRNLEEFYNAQKEYFPKRKSISERLENVQIHESKRMARVLADFVFIDEGVESPGTIGLHLISGKEGWKIVAIAFAYK